MTLAQMVVETVERDGAFRRQANMIYENFRKTIDLRVKAVAA